MKLRPHLRLVKPLPHFPTDGLAVLALVALCGSLFFRELGSRELWASHEARAAQNARRMLDDGDWLLPRLYDDQVELQKPVGYYWLAAATGRARGGVDAVAVRLPAAVAGTVTVLMVWGFLRRRGRPVAAVVAAAGLASAAHFTGTARVGRIDVPLTCAVTVLMLGGWSLFAHGLPARSVGEGREAPSPTFRTGRRLASIAPLGLVAAFALLLKGPIGFVLPAAALAIYWLSVRVPLTRFLAYGTAVGVIGVAVAAPWYLWANHETGGEFFRAFFLYHHVNRAFGGAEALAGHPWWYYAPRFAADFLPWTPAVLVALVYRRWRGDSDAWFGLVWMAVMIAVLSLSRFKRADYLLPAYPGAALFLGCVAERWFLTRSPRARRIAACGFAGGIILLPLGWYAFDRLVTDKAEATHEQAPFAHIAREATGGQILLFRVESHLLAFHLGRPVHTLVEWGELGARLAGPGPHFVVTRAEFLDEVRDHVPGPIEVLCHSADVTRAPPRRPLVLLRIDPGPNSWPKPPD
ncbi:MAG TPA: phospholipid carrier-dependent glycosyltransferase [Gemmataceae bacterium]|nr:phospholipid carrier-dependent glycosyltransferase [Gemmataceae bacterium]